MLVIVIMIYQVSKCWMTFAVTVCFVYTLVAHVDFTGQNLTLPHLYRGCHLSNNRIQESLS